MVNPTLFQRILSYLYPVQLKGFSSSKHTVLNLQYFKGQWMLATHDAIYSAGTSYSPFRKTFHKIRKELPLVQHFLLLGTGLGSALKILQTEYQCFPKSILVDYDDKILEVSKNYMELNQRHNVEWVCDDVAHFITETTLQFDLIGVDVFKDTDLSSHMMTPNFIQSCREHLTSKGLCILNCIFKQEDEQAYFENLLHAHFSDIESISHLRNQFYICRP